MLSALVDNSTLTAIQRLIGDIAVARSFPVEGDLSAFDQYLQSLILYDEIAVVDDYKEEFRISRKSSFKEVRFLSPNNIPYEQCADEAKKQLDDTSFQIRRGSIKPGPLEDLLDSLDLHVSPAWYMQSSEWFLQMRILADEADIKLPKYGTLMSTIKDQGRESHKSIDRVDIIPRIETRNGKFVDPNKVDDEILDNDVKEFASSLNWIAHRSVFYLLLCREMNCALSLQPIRHRYIADYATNTQKRAGTKTFGLTFLTSSSQGCRKSAMRQIRCLEEAPSG